MTVRSNGSHGRPSAKAVQEGRSCETVGAVSSEQIRLDKERTEQATFEQLKAELQHAFAAPEESYRPLTAAEVIAQNG